MTDNLKKFRDKLKEIFQLDQADLDFGIYRILNVKREEILSFLDNDLLPQVEQILGATASDSQAAKLNDLRQQVTHSFGKEAIEANGELSALFANTPLGREYAAVLQASRETSNEVSLEQEVFAHLYNFFSRYYKDGDFISLRRYKEGVYAIPYEGEEVKLYWANHDQYYIKTGEQFKDYAFKVADGRRVHFKLVDASAEKDNVKASTDKERRFSYLNRFEVSDDGSELFLLFAYQPQKGKEKQTALNEAAVSTILADTDLKRWLPQLAKPEPTEKSPDRSLLAKHLACYTDSNTFDYFIHKQLGPFLERELDFYLKNEVFYLGDVVNATPKQVEQQLSTVRAIRQVGLKIIRFIAQLEDFQKKLWLKKKFVVETNYCITLDLIPEEFYPEIAANDAQREEWVQLYNIDEVEDGDGDLLNDAKPGYSNPLSLEFLKVHRHMAIDTQFFAKNFVSRLMASLPDIASRCEGTLIHADNYQAISLLQAAYKEQIAGIYIDPPYNTDASPIVYKNGYRHSSWLCLITDRMMAADALRKPGAITYVAIDDYEYPHLSSALNSINLYQHLSTAVIRSKPQGRPTTTGFSANHEYAVFWGDEDTVVGRLPREGSKADRYPHRDDKGIYAWSNFRKSGSDSNRQDRARSFYPLFVEGESLRIPQMSWSEEESCWQLEENLRPNEVEVLPVDSNGNEKVWTCSAERAKNEIEDIRVVRPQSGEIVIQKKYRPNQEGALPGTWWEDPGYSASESGTKVLKDLFGAKDFDFPKSINLVIDCLRVCNLPPDGTALDYFAGSGTTGHAILSLNREDGGKRRYILAEQGHYFDTVLKPRLLKVAYSADWKNSSPCSRADGTTHCFKYIRLESYEDTLDNLQLVRSKVQDDLLSQHDGLREEYMLGYMLDMESRGSDSLLNIEQFSDPFNYKLMIRQDDELKETTVDLLETFNWLIGLRVSHIAVPQTFTADFERDNLGKYQVKGRLKQDAEGPWTIRKVEGETPDKSRVLILWRTLTSDIEQDNAVLDAWFQNNALTTQDSEFDLVYVNGDNNLPNLKRPDDLQTSNSWKVRLLEEEFHKRMWEDTES